MKTTPVDERVEPIKIHSSLRKWFSFTDYMLTWNFDGAPVEVSKEWAELFKMCCLITGIDCGKQKVSKIPQTKKSLEDASLSSRRI